MSTNGKRPGSFPPTRSSRRWAIWASSASTSPSEFGGLGLDYSYAMVMARRWATSVAAALPMAIGVQTDMATPALARFGSDALRDEFLAPAIAGDCVACLGVSEAGAGSDVASDQDHGAQGRRRLRHQRRQDVDHQRHPGRLDVPARQYRRRRGRTSNKSLIMRADEDQGRRRSRGRSTRSACAPPTPR